MEIADYSDNGDGSIRDFLIVVSEATGHRCMGTRDVVFFLDITQEDRPYPVSSFQVPEEPGDFCNQGGRFGPHGRPQPQIHERSVGDF